MAAISDTELLSHVNDIAAQAGQEILRVYETDFDVREKEDDSPVTEADQRAEALIRPALAELTPDIPVVAEEAVSAGHVPDIKGDSFWLVDPLDGTKEFIKRNGEFTVNIALIRDGEPVLGVVHAPAISQHYWGGPDGAWQQHDSEAAQRIQTRPMDKDGLIVVASRSHRGKELDEYLEALSVKEETSAGSSIKFCLVAAGKADLYPRFGRTMEWDTAAGHAVLKAAGGCVHTTDGEELAYGKPDFANPYFIAKSHPELTD